LLWKEPLKEEEVEDWLLCCNRCLACEGMGRWVGDGSVGDGWVGGSRESEIYVHCRE
jgi:hypothetical protein